MAGLNYNPREFQKILKNNGFVYEHQTGDHRIWKRDGVHISIPCTKLNPIIVQRLVKEHCLKVR